MKTGKIKSKKQLVLRRTAVILAFSAILFGKAAFGQETGYVTIGSAPEQYETFRSAYTVGGNSTTYTLHGGSVNMGGAINPGYQLMDITIKSSNDVFQPLDLGGLDRFLFSSGDSAIKLTFNKVTLTNGNNTENGGVISVLKTVKINGEFTFDRNQSQASGGAIFAGDDYATGGQVDVSGTNTFSSNTALGAGGAINAETINIRGTNTFSNNSAAGTGGAINAGNLTLSGDNTFTGNTSNNSNGGAINTSLVTFNAGNYTFTGNTAKGVPDYGYPGLGGAINAAGVTFQSGDGESMNAKFSGNTMIASDGSVKNDIYTYGYQGVLFEGTGTYSFEGGIQTANGSEGGMTLKNGADVTLESGSVNVIDNGLNIDGSTLNIVLNDKNRYENIADTPSFKDGATQFTANGINIASNNGVLRFVVDNAIQNYWYLGAIGNFNIWNDSMIITQVNGGDGEAEIAGEKLGSAIWLGITKGNFLATRKSRGTTTQNESNTFNGVFEDGSGAAFATNDVVYLADNLNATGEVVVDSGITAFGVVSNSTADVRTITATGDHRFFNVEGDTKITLDNVTFDGGNAGSNNHGGAILSDNYSTLTLNSTGTGGVTFQNNSAVNGGAVEAGVVNLNGTFNFLKNHASLNKQNYGDGGAIDAWDITIKGKNNFMYNTAVNGGAIWAQNLTFEGIDSIAYFSNNTASGSGNDIYIAKDWVTDTPGSLTFKDNGVYGFLGGVYVDGTTEMNDSVKVTFGNFSENTMNGTLTFNDNASVAFGYASQTTVNGALTINDNAKIAFEGNSDMTISGMTTMNSQQDADSADSLNKNTTLKFNGGLTLGDNVKQEFTGAEVTLGGTLGVTYGGDPNAFNSQADFSNVDSLTIADGTKFVIYDTAGNEMTAKDFTGKVIGDNKLVLGTPGSTELKKIVPDDFNYESLLYSVRLESGQDIVLKSSEKAIQPNYIEGNAGSAAELFGKGVILDVQTADEVCALTNGATGELFASSAAAQTERLNYMNRLIIARTAAHSSINQTSETIRGQQAEYTNSSIFGCSCCGDNDRKPNLWASGYYIGGETQMCDNINGQTYRSSGMLTGADWTTDFGKFGAFYGYSATGLDAIASDLESKDHTFGIWSRWDSVIGPGYTTVLGDFSFSNGEGRRFFQGNAWKSDYSAWQGAAYLERGLEFVGERMNLNPYFAMQYVGYSADASADAQLQYSALDADSLRTILGLRLDRDFCLRGRKANISTGFAWDHELLDTDLIFTAQRTGGGNIAPILGNSAGRDWFEYNTGLSVDWNDNITLSADYFLFANKYTTLNAGMGTVTFRY